MSNRPIDKTIYQISRSGGQSFDNSTPSQSLKSGSSSLPGLVPKTSPSAGSVVKSSGTFSNPKNLPIENGRVAYKFRRGNDNGESPGGNGNNNPVIGTSSDWTCPNLDEVITMPDYWNRLQSESEDNTCLDEEDVDCFDIDSELGIEEFYPRRRLLSVPTGTSIKKPLPTGDLDQDNLKKFDFTTNKVKPFEFFSREGILLSADHRSIKKVIYAHPMELGLTDLESRIKCPIQTGPGYQRVDCWAITDSNVKDALMKLFEFTTFADPSIVTAEMTPSVCSNPKVKATFFIDMQTGSALYFRIGGKQNGKLWSAESFPVNELNEILNKPGVKIITDYKNSPLQDL